jgi:hypothetical protein
MISPFTSMISSSTSSKLEELKVQEENESPFMKHAMQMETSTATPTSKEVSPSTAVTSPEPEQHKVQEEEEPLFIRDTKQMEATTSTPTTQEVSTSTSSEPEAPKKQEVEESSFIKVKV